MKIEDERDLHWLAGLLEGEGTFNAGGARNCDGVYTSIIVQISSTDLDVLEHANELMGGNRVFPVKSSAGGFNVKQMHRAQVAGVRAINLMLELYPLMGERRKQQILNAMANCARVQHLMEEHEKEEQP